MPKRKSEFFLVDILISIDKIMRSTKNITFEDFLANECIVDATLRNIEIIGEATGQLLKDSNFLKNTNVEWRKIVNFRNVIIHFYFGVDLDIVFKKIVLEEIPLLEKSIVDLIRNKNDLTDFLLAVSDTKEDFAELNRYESVAYLEKIESLLKK